MNNEDDFKVTSEILPFFERDTQSKPNLDDKNVVSKFTFTIPDVSGEDGEFQVTKDEDDDYVLPRKKLTVVITLEHSVSTKINRVALQIWRAALLLADFIIYSQKLFANQTVLELGSGVGLTSIVAGMFARQVVCTDLDASDILKLIRSNVERNKHILRGQVCVLGLDFFNREWSSDLTEKLKEVTAVLAADVIYDNDVTEAFVATITKILSIPPKKTLYLALEKRYVFTVSDLDTVAPCYEHLMSCLKSAQSKPPFSESSITEVPLNFPQYFKYDRVKQLVMFRITS